MSYFFRGMAALIFAFSLAGPVSADPVVASDSWNLGDTVYEREFSATGILSCESGANGDYYDVVFYRLADNKKFLINSIDELFTTACDTQNSVMVTLNGTFAFSTAFGINRIEVDDYETIRTLTAAETAGYLNRDMALTPLAPASARLR